MSENRTIFLHVPKNLSEQFTDKACGLFQIDPAIPIPVEIGEGENIKLENLSMEMILSGMLRVIEDRQVKQEWIDYYGNFILAVRPDVLTELKKIKDSGLCDENFIKANKLVREGKANEALAVIRSFLQRYPLVWNGWFVLGWALRLLDRWADGEAAFKKTIELGGDNSDTRNELAICLMEMGDIAAAGRELEAALKKDPENIKIISNLGVLALKTGDKEKAAAFFRTVLELDSGDPVAKKFLEG
jgi:tetratricopeptide (TPR) repeat protein